MSASERVPAPYGHVVADVDGRLVRTVSLRSGRAQGRASSDLAGDLQRYFTGERVDFSRYDVDWSQYTPFERAVLKATQAIPYGETRTYGEIAKSIGRPDAARAVGQALGKNRTCIVIPCHRVVAANGLGGFSGGLRWKQALLTIESVRRKA